MTDPMSRVAGVAGLGSMGFGMARSLMRAGFETYGFDIDPARVERLAALGGRKGAPGDAAGALDALVVVVVSGAQMEDVLFGAAGMAERMRPGTLVIGCPTVAPEFARDIAARLADRHLAYVDAPVSGGSARAEEGALTVMVSGAPAHVAAARPYLEAMALTIFELGDEPGPASAMKMINQLLAGVHIVAAAEAITFGLYQGIEPARTVDVISQCAGTSWMFENRGAHIVAGDYAPRSAVDIFIKDLGIVTAAAQADAFPVPLASAALKQFMAAGGLGLGREDDAAVAKVYARAAALDLPGANA
jgi:3-hydroxyisobutyrate dehydrogenase-like beta-hydroxyacid dehydrogenase